VKQSILTLILALVFLANITAQDKPDSECPSISVTGPAGIVSDGEIMTFTADVKGAGALDIKYLWSLSAGTIESGQGTPTINVRKSADVSSLTATVVIQGLGAGCAIQASETYIEEYAPTAEKLDQFSWNLNSSTNERLRNVAQAINNNPNAQLYIFTPPDATIRKTLADQLYKAIPEHGIDASRMTFVENASKNSLIQFWLVPPGATPPSKCEDCESQFVSQESQPNASSGVGRSICPSITIDGPPGLTMPGGLMTFRSLVSGKASRAIKYIGR
jgi:hypothetical protein